MIPEESGAVTGWSVDMSSRNRSNDPELFVEKLKLLRGFSTPSDLKSLTCSFHSAIVSAFDQNRICATLPCSVCVD